MSKFWSQKVHELTPYVPGEQPQIEGLIKLNTNENPYPPSPKVQQVLKLAADSKLQLYPDPNAEQLKLAIADYYQLNKDQVFVGNGSDEVLAHTFAALLKQDKPLLFPDISYSFYPVYCNLFAIDYQQVPLDQQFQINPEDYQIDNGGIILANPNAPTGIYLGLDKIEILLKQNPDAVVVIDEAYIDFGGQSAAALVNQYPNLLVIQTFSKSRSLAGLRVGFALGQADLIEALERVKNSFNSYPLDKLAQLGAIAAIEDDTYFQQCCRKIIASRKYLSTELKQQGFKLLESKTNFLFISHPEFAAESLALQLREHKILLRYFKSSRIDNYLRVTIGTQNECEALINKLKQMITEK